MDNSSERANFVWKDRSWQVLVLYQVTLEAARLKHQAEEKILHNGRNPMEVRKEEKRTRNTPIEANSAMKSFAEIEKEWFDHRKAGKQDGYVKQMETRIAEDLGVAGNRGNV